MEGGFLSWLNGCVNESYVMSAMLYGRRFPLRLKGPVNESYVKSAMLYGRRFPLLAEWVC